MRMEKDYPKGVDEEFTGIKGKIDAAVEVNGEYSSIDPLTHTENGHKPVNHSLASTSEIILVYASGGEEHMPKSSTVLKVHNLKIL